MCNLIAIRVHGGHDVDAGVVDHGGQEGVMAVVVTKQLKQQQQHLPSHHFVAVHVADVLELWLTCRKTRWTGFT